MRPLALDLLDVLIPLTIGAVAFTAGVVVPPRSKRFCAGLATLAVATVICGGLAVAGLLPFPLVAVIAWGGGGTVVLAWAALALLGIVWQSPKRAFSGGFLVTLAILAGGLVLLESSGRLWWRFAAPELWGRTPDSEGRLRQTNAATCSPTTAAMLLHKYGIAAGEGEMAYLAGTTVQGTDAYSMAAALTEKLRPIRRKAVVLRTEYHEQRELGTPFIAHVRLPGVGGHALLVERLTDGHAEVIDPIDGKRHHINRIKFEEMWDGTAVLVTEPAG